jgi:hypothetical protein
MQVLPEVQHIEVAWDQVDEVQHVTVTMDLTAPIIATVTTGVTPNRPTVQSITTAAAVQVSELSLSVLALSTLAPAAAAVQLVDHSAAAAGSIFVLQHAAYSSLQLAHDAPAAVLQAALNSAFTDMTGGVTVAGVTAGVWRVTFPAAVGAVAAMTSTVSAGPLPTVTVLETGSVQEVQQVTVFCDCVIRTEMLLLKVFSIVHTLVSSACVMMQL